MATRTFVNVLAAFFLWALPAQAEKPIEVVAGGVSYTSMEEYRNARTAKIAHKRIFKAKDKVKPLKHLIKPADPKSAITPEISKRLRLMGYENGLNKVQIDFKQNWNQPGVRFIIPRDELEDRLKAVGEGRKEPLLFIADGKTVRVMALEHGGEKASK